MDRVHNTKAFRTRYRENINSTYNGWYHLSSIVLFSILAVTFCLLQLQQTQITDWLMMPIGVIIYNFNEYISHRWAGHKKVAWAKLFYKRHTGDHHSFFSAPLLFFESIQDWRLVLFPTYLTIAHALLIAPTFGFLAASIFSANAGYVLALSLITTHMMYELLHLGYHQPKGHWFHKIPGLRELAHLHRIHHHRQLMTLCNFNLTFPLFDLIWGTYHWEPLHSFDDQTEEY